VPIGHITNGVHTRTWVAPLMADLYARHLGENWSGHVVDPGMWAQIEHIPDAELWHCHQVLKERLIAHARFKIKRSRQERGEAPDDISAVDQLLNPKALTIGFARRFSPYKRGALIMHDFERAIRIIGNAKRPVQIIFSGKAHPADEEGKRIIQRLIEWCRHPALRDRVAFIENYDIFTAKKLVHGIDIWLNNPRRPLEASGTSGQKVCFNGGINFSVLDGWWCEGYQVGPEGKGLNGWAIGEDAHTSDQKLQDQIDADSLYQLLEDEIIPLYYDQDEQGIPHGWTQLMKASIRTNAPAFNSDRMVAEYVAKMYAPETTAEIEPILASMIS
ncbi:MAG: alpha-glucan family phosphorylase, partial [Cyanothece sp. SIO1E1]|nr:alpha-glucan family phosphorylase [Cyanothece sp. SIO1E1]